MPRHAALSLSMIALLAATGAAVRAAEPPEAKVEHIIVEDDGNRIEEIKVRGQTQKVTVQPKNSKAPAYEIVMGDGSRELSPGAGSNRGTVGQRGWRILAF